MIKTTRYTISYRAGAFTWTLTADDHSASNCIYYSLQYRGQVMYNLHMQLMLRVISGAFCCYEVGKTVMLNMHNLMPHVFVNTDNA